MSKKYMLQAVVAGLVLAAGAHTPAFADEDEMMMMEKCYGVAMAGKNDCATAGSSCAGTAKNDAQKDAFLALPKGTCERLVGGSLESMDG